MSASSCTKPGTEVIHTYTLLSDYDWSPAGVQAVRSRYQTYLQAMGQRLDETVRMEYNPDTHCFRVNLVESEEAASTYVSLHNIVRDIIKQETEDIDREDPVQSDLIMRLGERTVPRLDSSDDATFPSVIASLAYKQVWHCRSSDRCMDLIIPARIVKKLEQFVTIALNFDEQCIFLGSDTSAAVSAASCKLDNVHRAWSRWEALKEGMRQEHVFYAEELADADYKVALTPVTHVRKYASRILFDHLFLRLEPALLDSTYAWLQDMYAVRCYTVQQNAGARVGSLVLPRAPRPIHRPRQADCACWKNFQYTVRGTPLRFDIDLIEAAKHVYSMSHAGNIARVDQWVNSTTASAGFVDAGNAFEPANLKAENATVDFFDSLDSGALQANLLALKPTKVAESEEVSNRIFHSTMQQQAAGRTKQVAIDPQSSVLRHTNAEVFRTLECMKDWDGPCTFEAKIGRYLMSRGLDDFIAEEQPKTTRIHSAYRDGRTASLEEMFIQTKKSLISHFTTAVTSSPFDVQSIMEQSVGGQRLWQSDMESVGCPPWKVTYELVIANVAEKEIIWIYVDANNFDCFATYTPTVLCNIVIHAMKRNWDVCVEASGRDKTASLKYAWLLEDIKEHAYVEPAHNALHLDFMFDLSGEHSDISIVSVRAHKRCDYPSKDLQSMLHITEINRADHVATRVSQNGKDMLLVHATPAESEPGYEKAWFEVSVSSTCIDAALKENEDLEVGDGATWTDEDFLAAGAIEAIYRPALAMVKSMDNIGYGNNNGFMPQGDTDFGEVHSVPATFKSAKEVSAHAQEYWTDFQLQ